MKKYEIIKKNFEFNDIINTGAYLKNKYYYVYYKKNSFSYSRFGLAVSKKMGNAVERNKYKRQLRMIIHENKIEFSQDYDFIIMPRTSLKELNYQEMAQQMISLVKRGNY